MSTRFESPFPPLQLSRYEAGQLEELARVVIGQVMDQFETHLADPKRFVDPARWKLVKEREDIHIYKERSPGRKQRRRRRATDQADALGGSPLEPRPFAFSVTSEDLFVLDGEHHIEPQQRDHASSRQDEYSDLPILMSVGTLRGDLNDIMYGVANPTTESMRIKSAYIQDQIVNGAVLARLKEPTRDDPFRSMTIKWCIKGQALHLRTLVSNRDLVYLEATGLARLPRSGELVGYQMLHSVEFRQTHPVPGCLRGNLSIVGLYRQHREGVVETFGKGFVNPTGPIVRALVVKSASDVMLSSWRTMHTAQMKKLAHAVRRRQAVAKREPDQTPLVGATPDKTASCGVCHKSTNSSFLPLALSRKAAGRYRCRLCQRVLCATCRVQQRLASIAPSRALCLVSVSFCAACVAAVAAANAFDIAVDELVQQERGLHAGSFGSSLSPTETIGDRSSTADSLIRF